METDKSMIKFLKRKTSGQTGGWGGGEAAGRWWLPVFVMAGITMLSGSAGVQTGPIQFVGMDKVGHVVVFGMLAISVTRCWDVKRHPNLAFWTGVLVAVGFGLGDELHQLTNPYRYFEWADWVADIVGGLLGAAAYVRVGWIRRILEQPVRLRWKKKVSR